jgi:WD40 repeat protein
MLYARLALALWVVTVLADPVRGQHGALKDANGDPLPPGAFTRLGATRFRVPGAVFGARYVDGGKKLLLRVQNEATEEGTFRLLDAESGVEQGQVAMELNKILGHWHSSGGIAEFISFSTWSISPDAKRIASIQYFGSSRLQVRELATGKVIFEVNANRHTLSFVQFSPDGTQLAVIAHCEPEPAKNDQEPQVVIQLWDLQKRKEIRTLVPPHAKASFQAHWLMFSPNGAYLAASGYDGNKAGVVRVWDVAGKNPSWKLEGHIEKRELTRAIAFSPDSKALAAGHNGKITLWDPTTGKRIKDVGDFADRCAALDFSPDGTRLIAGSGPEAACAGQVRMWDLSNSREIQLPVQSAHCYLFSEDSATLGFADANDGSVVLCDGATGQLRRKIDLAFARTSGEHLEHLFYKARQGMGWSLALSPDARTLVACDKPGQLRRFEVATGKEIPAPGSITDPASVLAFSPDGKKLLAAGRGRVLMHAVDGKIPPRELLVKVDPSAMNRNLPKKPDPTCLGFSSDGKRVAAGWEDGVVALWHTDTGQLLWQAAEHDSQVACMAFGPDDRTLLSAGFYQKQVIWRDVSSGERQRIRTQDPDNLHVFHGPIEIGPHARTAYIPTEKGLLEWELLSGKLRREVKPLGTTVTLSSDGRFLLAIDAFNNAYHLMDLVSGMEQRSFAFVNGERATVNLQALARFSPDGHTIAGIAGKDIVRLWDRDSGTLRATLSGHNGGVRAVAFSPDGNSVATGAADGTILLWKSPSHPVAVARKPIAKQVAALAEGKDGDGDPLPAGARARLGLLRFQHGTTLSRCVMLRTAKLFWSRPHSVIGRSFLCGTRPRENFNGKSR